MESNGTQIDIVNYPLVRIGFCTAYAIIFLTSSIGNTMVISAVFRNKNMHSVTNFFIANLAISDVLMALFAVTLSPLYTFLGRWVFGEALCHLLPFIQAISVYISTLTLMAIAIERYYVIVHPFKPRMKISSCYICLVCMWLLAAALTTPYGLYMRVIKYGDMHYCEEHWPQHIKHFFTITTAIIQFIIPFTAMTFCYVVVFIRLSSRAKSRLCNTKCSQKEEADRDRKKKVNRMLISMVLIFACCWLPLTLLNLLNDFIPHVLPDDYCHVIFMTSHVVAMSSICYNPFLYAWLNENFRREFRSITPCIVDKNNMRRISTTNTTFHETAVTTYSLQPAPSVLDEKPVWCEELPLQQLATLQETSSEYNVEANSCSDEASKIQVSDNTKREWL